jgi:precorrin-6B methylase 2
MKYSKMLREKFSGISLNAEDLLLLESFQIKYLPERLPHKELSVLIRAYPFVRHFLVSKNPSMKDFLDSVLKKSEIIEDEKRINEICDELIWEIADLIVYNKYPEKYDEMGKFNWRIDEIIPKETLAGKLVADVGAGSGMLAFLLAEYAGTVYAVEPISSFRNLIRKKASDNNYTNVFAVDGFLESIPFPANTFNFLFTSNAIGWNIEKELPEIERVVKPEGQAIHIMRVSEGTDVDPVHEKLISGKGNYSFQKIQDERGLRLKYSKTIRNETNS